MAITNKHGAPQEFVAAYKTYRSSYSKGDAYKSASGIIAPVQASELIRQHAGEIDEDIADVGPALMGSMAHTLMEAATFGQEPMAVLRKILDIVRSDESHSDDEPLRMVDKLRLVKHELVSYFQPLLSGRVVEERLFATVEVPGYGPVRISGKMDLQKPDAGSAWTIRDYKFTRVWTVIDGLKEEWDKQANIYAFLLRENGREVAGAEIVAWLKDWSYTRSKYESNYPERWWVVLHPEIRDHEWMRQWIIHRLKLHLDAEHHSSIPDCTAKERWVRESKWEVRKPGNKRASRLLDSEAEAQEWVAARPDGGDFEISFREGESTRCARYCSAAPWCPQWAKIQEAQEKA